MTSTNYTPYTPPASRPDESESDAKTEGKPKGKGKSKNSSKDKKTAETIGVFVRYGFIGLVVFGLVIVIGLNFQPWLRVGEEAALLIVENPIVWLVSWVPILGGFANWLLNEATNLTKTVAFIAWGTAQFTQTFPMIAKFLKRKGVISKGITKKFQIVRVLSYVVEVIVSFVAYPPYRGGWVALQADLSAQTLDFALVDRGNIITAILTIALFEVYCHVCIETWRIISK